MKSLARTAPIRLALTIALLATPALAPAFLAGPAAAQARGHGLPQRGDYLPPEALRAGPNVDAGAAHLRRPPSGFGWFSLGGVFVMASLSSGLIVEVVAP
jgi:hypothetical protein